MGVGSRILVEETMQLLEGTSGRQWGTGGKTSQMLGSWPDGHLCVVSKLSRLLGSRGLAQENYAVL